MLTAKPPVDFDRVYLGGKYAGMTVREMLLSSYTVEPDGCWRWSRSITNRGYGQFGYWAIVDGVKVSLMYQAHRAFAELFGMDISKGLVLHSCDHPYCVNPDHLRVGTLQDNMDDKVARGRVFRPHGEIHPNARLTSSDVIDIRRRAKMESRSELAAEYGVTAKYLSRIVSGVKWPHIPLNP